MAISKRIFCDTNFLLDICDAEREAHGDAIALLWYCADNPALTELVASITSFKDAYYILSRLYKDEALARNSVERIMGALVKPVDMLSRYGNEALDCDEPDFEDALIRVCAEHENVDFLISRDEKAFASCPIPSLSAAEFLEREGFDYAEIDW